MGETIQIEIAGTNFSIHSRKYPILQNSSPLYQQFIKAKGNCNKDIHCDIDLKLNNSPDTGKMTKIFDSNQSWAMFLEGKNYFLEFKPPAFNKPLWTTQLDMNMEQAIVYCGGFFIHEKDGRISIMNPVSYPLDQLLLMYILSDKEGALFHAAGVNLNGKGYIFPGRSGAGKSTISRQFAGAKNSVMLSDDRVIVRKTGNSFKIFGTPWPGDEKIAENKSAQLKGIFFISHSTENMVKDIKPVEALKKLMPVTSIPWFDRDVVPKILNFCEELVSNIPAYELYFKPDTEVVKFLEEFSAS